MIIILISIFFIVIIIVTVILLILRNKSKSNKLESDVNNSLEDIEINDQNTTSNTSNTTTDLTINNTLPPRLSTKDDKEPSQLDQMIVLGAGIGGQIALQLLATQVDKLIVRGILSQTIKQIGLATSARFGQFVNSFAQFFRSMMSGLAIRSGSLYSIGANLSRTMFVKAGNIITNTLINMGKTITLRTSTQIAIQSSVAAARTSGTVSTAILQSIIAMRAAVATATMASTQAATIAIVMSNPITILLLVFAIINIALDVADVSGYGMLTTMKVINREIKKSIHELINDINESNLEYANSTGEIFTPFIYPSIIGPIDRLSITEASPDIIKEKCLSIMDPYPTPIYKGIYTDINGNIVGTVNGNLVGYNIVEIPTLNGKITSKNNNVTNFVGNITDIIYNDIPTQIAGNIIDTTGNIIGSIIGNIIDYNIKLTPQLDNTVIDPVTGNYIGNVIGNDPTMFSCLLSHEINNIIEDPTIPIINTYLKDIKKYNDTIKEIIVGNIPGDINDQINEMTDYINNFFNVNIDTITNIASNTICNDYGGFMTLGENPVCSYTKENCVDEKILPPKVCTKGEPKKCETTPSINCTGGAYIVADNDVEKLWSNDQNVCLTSNGVIKTMCISNNINYNVDTDMCEITVEQCLSKAGTPTTFPDGTVDCDVPMGQQVAEMIFGKTFTDTLIQTFSYDNYKCPRDDLIDMKAEKGLMDIICEGPEDFIEFLKEAAVFTILIGICVVGAVATAGASCSLLASLVPLCLVRDYSCRDPCPEGLDYYGVACIGKGKNNGPPCDPGWNFDGVQTCNAKVVQTKLIVGELPSVCPDGYKPNSEILPTFCIQKKCDEPGDKDQGLTCRAGCKNGFRDIGGVCWSNRNEGVKIANREACDVGYVYDGVSTCNMKDTTLDRGAGIIPTECDDGYENVGGTCWEKCPPGSKDKGATCEICDDNLENNGASLCYEKCQSGYVYDGTKTCNYKPHYIGSRIMSDCPDNYNNNSGICYKACPAGDKQNELNCESCPANMQNNGAGICHEDCRSGYRFNGTQCEFIPVTVGAGIPKSVCRDGYDDVGTACVKKIDGYKTNPGDLVSYHLDESLSKAMNSKPAKQDNSACNDLTSVTYGVKTCTGTCKRTGCGCRKGDANKDCSTCNDLCSRSSTGRKCSGIKKCKGCLGCTGTVTTRDCNVSCPSGQRYDDFTDGCWEDSKSDCPDGALTATRSAPRSCDSGYEFKSSDTLRVGECYGGCPDGFEKRPGDLVSCWNTKPLTKPIPPESIEYYKCPQNNGEDMDLVGSLCYKKCPEGTTRMSGASTQCTAPNGTLLYSVKTDTIKSTVRDSTPATCQPDEYKESGLCKGKCNDDEEKVPGIPTQCQGKKGLNYIINTNTPKTISKKSKPATCKSNREKAQGLCYIKCSEKYGECYETVPGIPTNCQPLKGLSYKPKIADNACGEGYVFDGENSCVNSYVPKTYTKGNEAIICPNGHSKVQGLCYEKCPTIRDDEGNQIKLGHIDIAGGYCAPPRGKSYPPSYTASGAPFSIPKTYTKVRAVAMSSKNDVGGIS